MNLHCVQLASSQHSHFIVASRHVFFTCKNYFLNNYLGKNVWGHNTHYRDFSTIFALNKPLAGKEEESGVIMELAQKVDKDFHFDARQKIGMDDVTNESIVQELVGRTLAQVRAQINRNTSCNVIKETIKGSFDAALKEYFRYRDDPRQFDKFKFVLIDQLKDAFREFCLDHTNQCSAVFSEAGSSFRLYADTAVNAKCLPLDMLNGILSDVKANVIREYEGSGIIDLDQLNKRLDDEIQVYISVNNTKLAQIYYQYNSILPALLEKYEDLVEMKLPDEDLETASEKKFESTLQFCKKAVFDKLNENVQFDGPEIKAMFEERTEAVLVERFAEKTSKAKLSKEKRLAEAAKVVNNAIERFKKSLTGKFGELGSDYEIDSYRKTTTNELMMTVTVDIYEILPDRKDAKEMLEHVKQSFETFHNELQSRRLADAQQFQNQWDAELNSICETFNQQFNARCQPAIMIDLDELRNERKLIISGLIRRINWLNGQADLLESFKAAAKANMMKLSEPVLERHAKLLEHNFVQQQQVMSGCLETYQMEMKELLKREQTDDVHVKAKSLGDATIKTFETQVRTITPISPTATKTLLENLRREIASIQSRVDMEIQNRILSANAEVSKLIEDCEAEYKHLINAFSIASNYAQEKMHQVHNNLKARSLLTLQKNLRLTKYAGDVRKQQLQLESMVDRAYKDAMVAIDNQRAEWNQKLISCHQKAINHYKQMFNSNLGKATTEEELQNLHDTLKEQAVALWEESFPFQYFGDKLLPERRKFANNLDTEFRTTISPMWHQINVDTDRSTRDAVEKIVKRYEEQMITALHWDCNLENFILLKHEKFAKEASNGLNKVEKPKNISKKVYDDLLASRLDNTLTCFRTENAQKMDAIRNGISDELLHLKETSKEMLWNLKVFPECIAPEQFNSCKVQALSSVNRFKIPNDFRNELASFAETKLKETFADLKSEWDAIQPEENQLLLAINTAVNEYNQEMSNRTSKTGQVFNSKRMTKYHEHSMQIVRKKFEDSVKQTSSTRERFNKAIGEVLKKYEDLNDLRAAEHSEATVGIDLGTTFSCVAIYKGDKIEMIPDREHHSNTVPSYVFYESAVKTVVGHSAKDQSVIHPQTTIFDSKRLIGRKFNDSQVQEDITQWPFKVIADPDKNRKEPKIRVHKKTFHPEEISAEILKHLKTNAELYLGRPVRDVVITVPAYFNDAQKRATKHAAALASINVLEIISEPTSAAIAYSLNYTDGKTKNILVFDLGGGTFDVSVLTTEKCNIAVKAVGGDNHLGGEDFDSNMVDFCIEKFRQETGLTIPKNVSGFPATAEGANDEEKSAKVFESLRRLRQKCEQAKINLSKTDKVRVVVDYIYKQENLDVEITVEDFNEMNRKLFKKCIKVVEDTVIESKLSKADIDDVVLVGGSSRIPEVQHLLSEFFGGKSLIMTLNPDEVVAQGAAYRAAMLSGSKSRELAAVKFQDVNPLSLGIEVLGRKFSIILPKNTPLPSERTETYVTTVDYQTAMEISIYEGEDVGKIANNNLLGEFTLTNIPSKRRAQEPVDVTIKCDEEGLIHVTAKVRSTDNSNEIEIQSNRGGLTEEDIEKVLSGKRA